MMHQTITCPEYVANVINNIADKDIYQIIPFGRNNNSLFLILYEDCSIRTRAARLIATRYYKTIHIKFSIY